MAMDYYEKSAALANLATALKAAGWTVFKYEPAQYSAIENGRGANWLGHAEHKNYPGLKVVSAFFWAKYNQYEGRPTQRTPAGYMWHIEQDGVMVGKGKGFTSCGYNSEQEGHDLVVDAITKLCKELAKADDARHVATDFATPIGITQDRNWIWVKFQSKPNEIVRQRLHGAGGKYSTRRQAWFFTDPTQMENLRTMFPDLAQ